MKGTASNPAGSKVMKAFIYFIRYNANQIKQGGWPVLLRKVKGFLLLLPFIPVVLIVRALRPLVLIRFGLLSSKGFGGLVKQPEERLYWRDVDLDNQRTFDIFYHNRQSYNQQLKKMWERRLYISRFASPIDTLNRLIPGGKSHVIPWLPNTRDNDIFLFLRRTPVYLSFTPEEERLGRERLQAMGIPEGTPFVCFHSRDSKYKEVVHPEDDAPRYTDRNSDIQNHVPAAEEMTRRGYYAIRMGAIVKEPLQTTNPMIIDYATNYRSDFMDIYLCPNVTVGLNSCQKRFCSSSSSSLVCQIPLSRSSISTASAVISSAVFSTGSIPACSYCSLASKSLNSPSKMVRKVKKRCSSGSHNFLTIPKSSGPRMWRAPIGISFNIANGLLKMAGTE